MFVNVITILSVETCDYPFLSLKQNVPAKHNLFFPLSVNCKKNSQNPKYILKENVSTDLENFLQDCGFFLEDVL